MSVSPGRRAGRRFSDIRGTVGVHTKRALATRQAESQETDTVLARARLEKATLTEEYFYLREISRNRSTSVAAAPEGHIEFVTPYDGDRYFSRQARADVANAARLAPNGRATTAQIGHLLITDHKKTNLDDVLHLNETYESVPIRVPIDEHGSVDDLDHLSADRLNCVTVYDYTIESPREFPVAVDVELFDPDSLYSMENGDTVPNDPALVVRRGTFLPYLYLKITVSVTVPTSDETHYQPPTVRRVSIDWPTITSLTDLKLFLNSLRNQFTATYNPLLRCIEWYDVPMPQERRSQNGMTVTYSSEPMVLSIGQPGELYQEPSIGGVVEVEIPGRLLSGTQARLYDGHGRPDHQPLEIVSRVHTRLELRLDDAFSRRIMTPYQLLHFDEVKPDAMRFTDIQHALKDRGFVIQDQQSTQVIKQSQFIVAERPAGPDTMTLLLYIEGARYETERTTLVGGLSYTSKKESGELNVHMSGRLAGDSKLLTQEMNALQVALRHKFAHLQSRH